MSHTCQDDLVLKVTQTDVPYFNAPIYLENKQQVKCVKRKTVYGIHGYHSKYKKSTYIVKTREKNHSKLSKA